MSVARLLIDMHKGYSRWHNSFKFFLITDTFNTDAEERGDAGPDQGKTNVRPAVLLTKAFMP